MKHPDYNNQLLFVVSQINFYIFIKMLNNDDSKLLILSIVSESCILLSDSLSLTFLNI